uniref:RHS repeat domain-containing protein n=1 Tax=Bacteroides uniformis TaxID=820 RepID=UPI00293BD4E8
ALTASVATVLGSSNKIYTAYYYDIKGRVVKTVQSNPLGGYDVAATVYTFTNKPATVTHTHTASGKTTRTEVYTYSYDHADRLLKVEHTLGGTKITLADYAYDNLGRLQSKSLHGSATNKLTYAYNVRGWLTGISGSKFTQNLYYNNGNGTAKYNGSISSMTWKAGNESTIRGYKFTYDGLSRLINATYGETAGINTNTNRFSENVTAYDKNGNIKTLQRYGQTAASGYGLIDNLTFTLGGNLLNRVDDAAAASAYGGGFEFKDGVKQANEYTNATYGETAGINTNTNRFSENVTAYDKNGNIKTLQRYGQTAASSYGLIDNLTFTLAGNQLSRVDDAAAASAYNGGFEFKDGVKQANEYTYDSNGNLTKDLNKGISTITYNVLNLPNMVTFSDGSTIAYTYGADGTKLKTVHKTGSTTTTTDYCGNVVYENGVQKLLLTDEGYVTLSDGKYHYYLKDHQGNNRVVINQSGTVEEANHYYPFGGVFASSGNVQPYKYNGKEYDSKKGLNWYDYGARHYDAVLGRFTTNDRFAEKYYSMSPYQYGANSPVGNIDVNGDSIIIKPNANGIIDQIKVLFGYDTKFQKDVKADLFQLKQDDKKVADIIGKLEESKNIHYITMPKKGEYNSTGFNADKVKKNISQGSEIYYNPYNRRRGRNDSDMRTPRIGLAHELQHSFDVDKKVATYERTKNGILLMDIRAINTENRIRKVIGEPKRTMYGTQKVPKELLE